METNTYKESLLNQDELKHQLKYIKTSGKFIWISDKHNQTQIINTEAGTLMNHGYVRIVINGKGYLAHRLAWLYVIGDWPTYRIDHKDLNKSNNSWNNLKEVTNRINNQNKSMHRIGNKLVGACWDKERHKWYPAFWLEGRPLDLGRYESAEVSHVIYKKACELLNKGITDRILLQETIYEFRDRFNYV